MKPERTLYLICAADRLETAFFCGTAKECTEVLGLSNTNSFRSAVSRKHKIMNYFRIEKVRI